MEILRWHVTKSVDFYTAKIGIVLSVVINRLLPGRVVGIITDIDAEGCWGVHLQPKYYNDPKVNKAFDAAVKVLGEWECHNGNN